MLVELRKREPTGWGAQLLAPRPPGGHEGFTVVDFADNRITLRIDNPHAPRVYLCDVVWIEGLRMHLSVIESHLPTGDRQ